MTYVDAEARQDVLDAIATATNEVAAALAALGTAYELLDEATGDRLEEELFRPVQTAYGRAKRTHAGFAGRFDLPTEEFIPAPPPAASHGVKPLIDDALVRIGRADAELGELQDSMLPVEVGDQQLRAELAEVRSLLGPLPGRAQAFVRVFGR